VTAIGLIFAVLTERIRWSVAFKIAVFMPMAVSLFAAGVIWRIMYQQEPSRGALNAVTASVVDRVKPPGPLSDALPSGSKLTGTPQSGIVLRTPVRPGLPA
jgi:alpha-glucoside transport system permease protein